MVMFGLLLLAAALGAVVGYIVGVYDTDCQLDDGFDADDAS